MTHDQLQHLLDAYGADTALWPTMHRHEALALTANDPTAQAMWDAARDVDALLARYVTPHKADEIAAARVITRLAAPLPRQRASLWRWPSVLLNLDLAPSWPRVAALAGCAVIGFSIGIAGLDRPIDQLGAAMTAASRIDAGSIFEDEPILGARP